MAVDYSIVVLFLAFWFVPGLSSTNETNPVCSYGNDSICIDECYITQPPQNIYLNDGDSLVVAVETRFNIAFFTHFKDSVSVNIGNKDMICKPDNCVFDLDSPRLEIVSFDSSVVGSYEIQVFAGTAQCKFPFTISQAVAPMLTKENSDTFLTLDADEGHLELSPTVNHGIPPGVVVWYKDGVNISTGDMFEINPVSADDRGIYTARIDHQAKNVTLEYEVRINFPPIITLSTDPAVTSSDVTNVEISCTARSYPIVTILTLMTGGNSVGQPTINQVFMQDTLDYEAEVTHQVSGCPIREFTCSVTNEKFVRSATIRICERAPDVTNLGVVDSDSTNVSVRLTWTINPPSTPVTSYEFEYREDGNSAFKSETAINTDMSHTVTGLSPATRYEFRVRAVHITNGNGPFSPTVNFTTFTGPSTKPVSLRVTRNSTAKTIHLTWVQSSNTPSYAPITSYIVIYYTSADSTPQLVPVNEGATSFTLSTIDSTLNYSFSVKARNNWGTSDASAVVVSPAEITEPPRVGISINLSVEVSDHEVVLTWSLQSSSQYSVSLFEIQISRVESVSSQTVNFFSVYNWNTTNNLESGQQCFNQLNSSETYQFCIQPHLESGRMPVLATCKFGTTSSRDTRLTGATSCINVTAEPLAGNEVIPSWAIAVMVVGAVCLVVVVFGGCGLYYGLRKNKKGEQEYGGHNEMFDKLPHDHGMAINGNYPYPPPPPRSASPPSRSCMSSYRHNHHGHQMDWQGVTAV